MVKTIFFGCDSCKSLRCESCKSLVNTKRRTNLRRAFLWSLVACLFVSIFGFTPRLNPDLYSLIVFSPIYTMTKETFEGFTKNEAQPLTMDTKDGFKLRAWLFPGSKKPGAKTVLVCHGKSASMMYSVDFARYFRDKFGASVMLFDYRGHGYSTGKPSIDGICQDGLVAFDYLVEKKKVDAKDIVVVGESLGSLPACQILKHRKCAGVIVNCGFGSLPRKLKEMAPIFGIFPEWFLYWDERMDNSRAVAGTHSPFIIAHGETDNMFNVDTHAKALYAAASEPKKLLVCEGVGHSREFLLLNKYVETIKPLFQPEPANKSVVAFSARSNH